MFPVNLLRIRSFTAANTAIMFIGMAMGGTFLLVVIFLVSVLGYSELRAAVALTVMPVIALIVAPNAGRLNDRIGPRFPAAIGAAFFAVGLRAAGAARRRRRRCGTSCGASSSSASAWASPCPPCRPPRWRSLPPQVRGVGSGSLNTMRQVGFTLGVAAARRRSSRTPWRRTRSTRRSEAVGLVAAQPQIPARPRRASYAHADQGNAARPRRRGGGAAR